MTREVQVYHGMRHTLLRAGPVMLVWYWSTFWARGLGWRWFSRVSGTLYGRVGPLALVVRTRG